MSAQHRIVQDHAGWGCWPRLTCYGERCDGATLLRYPYESVGAWLARKEQFLDKHANRTDGSPE